MGRSTRIALTALLAVIAANVAIMSVRFLRQQKADEHQVAQIDRRRWQIAIRGMPMDQVIPANWGLPDPEPARLGLVLLSGQLPFSEPAMDEVLKTLGPYSPNIQVFFVDTALVYPARDQQQGPTRPDSLHCSPLEQFAYICAFSGGYSESRLIDGGRKAVIFDSDGYCRYYGSYGTPRRLASIVERWKGDEE